jgi:hypothetical protein
VDRKKNHSIVCQVEKRNLFRRELVKIAENGDRKIGPRFAKKWSSSTFYIFQKTRRLQRTMLSTVVNIFLAVFFGRRCIQTDASFGAPAIDLVA